MIMDWQVRSQTIAMVALFSMAALAGCIGNGGEEQQTTPTPTAQVTENTGGIEGVVTSDEDLPIEGASVGVPELGAEAVTDAQGTFALSDLAPGSYQVFVQKIGYESLGKTVDVAAGDVTRVDVQLAPQPVAEPRQSTVIWNGYMKCSIATQLFLSEECGEGIGTPIGTFGKDPNNKIDWDFEQLEQPATLLTETWWEPASDFASRMNVLVVTNLVCDPVCGWDEEYGREDSPPPVRIVMEDGVFPDDAESYPVAMTVRHWADAGDEEIVIVLEQPFEVYKTEFFGVPMEDVDPEYTALPPEKQGGS